MAATIAVLADMHLPRSPSAAQWAALEWALGEVVVANADLIVVAGDVTACGSADAARRFRARLDATGLPFLITPGNSDLRSADEADAVAETLLTPLSFTAGIRVVVADSSPGAIALADRERLDQDCAEGTVLVTHMPPETLDAESAAWLDAWARQRPVDMIVVGHRHRDATFPVGSAVAHQTRGLDPDKAIGGPPAAMVLESRGGAWSRRDIGWPEGDASTWADAERDEFLSLLGISCMGDGCDGLRQARELGVRRVELRASAAEIPRPELMDAVAAWRDLGGETLSWHMPNVGWASLHGDATELQAWRDSLEAALAVGADALTVHVPRVPVGLMRHGSEAWHGFSDFFARELAPAAEAGLTIGIENLHMNRGEPDSDERGFGYLPDECLAWIAEVRARLDGAEVGMLLDVGHARNNAPYSSEFTLSAWYERVGHEIVGYHVHQVVLTDGALANHQPIESAFGPLISFSSFLWAWRAGQLRHAPMYLEVRGSAGREASLDAFRGMLRWARQ